MKHSRWLLSLFLVASCPIMVCAQDQNNLIDSSKFIAETVVGHLKNNLPATGKFRVAVLLFGDENRKYPQKMGTLGPQLQGQSIEALKDALTAAVSGGDSLATKFSVASQDNIQDTFQSTANDVGGLTDKNVDQARKILKAEMFDVGIVGHFEFDGSKLTKDTIKPIEKISVTLILPDGDKKFGFGIKSSEILLHILNGSDGGDPSGAGTADNPLSFKSRFKVEVFANPKGNDPNKFESIPLSIVTDPASPVFRSLILLVDPDKYKGRRYFIRVTNKAEGAVSYLEGIGARTVIQNDNDKDRCFLLSSYVDGVSTIKRKTVNNSGVSVFEKDVRNYSLVRKYALTGPGRQFVKDTSDDDRFSKSKLVNVTGEGNSKVDMMGFLKIDDENGQQSTSDVFVFGDAKESVGQEFVGTGVSQIGIISLFFFAEEMPGDKVEKVVQRAIDSDAGTMEGANIPTPTITVGLKKVYKIPVETWHIVYKYKSSSDPTTVPVN